MCRLALATAASTAVIALCDYAGIGKRQPRHPVRLGPVVLGDFSANALGGFLLGARVPCFMSSCIEFCCLGVGMTLAGSCPGTGEFGCANPCSC